MTETKQKTGKNLGGRPLKYKNAEVLQAAINDYFKNCDEKGEPYTICGLALAMDIDRYTLLNYSNKIDEYRPIIQRAKDKCEAYAERALFKNQQVAGTIFNLKNNYKWKDKTETEVTIKALPERMAEAEARLNKNTPEDD